MAEPRKSDIKKSILNRVRMLYILFFAVGVAIAGKILYIQYGPGGESLRSKGERISYERVAIEADRGDVLAWDGRLLATSVPMYEVRMEMCIRDKCKVPASYVPERGERETGAAAKEATKR